MLYEYLQDEILLYISIIIKQLTNTAQVFVRKKGKCTGLLSTLILESNKMNSDMIMDGRVGFAV